MAVRNLPEMPCGPLLELQGQRKRFHIPYGLKPLMEDMTLEVLKVQPPDLVEFLAGFLEERVRKKEEEEAQSKSRRKSWLVHRWSWEASSVLSKEAFRDFIKFLPITEDNADHYAIIIQSAYRGHQARERVKDIRRNKKSGFEREAAYDEFLKALQITVQQADHYATKIQAAYKGFHTREMVKEIKEYGRGSVDIDVTVTEINLEQNPDEDELEMENEGRDEDGIINSDNAEEDHEWEGSSSELDEDARIYDALDSATEEEEESVTGDEMAEELEEINKVGSEIINSEEIANDTDAGDVIKENVDEGEEEEDEP